MKKLYERKQNNARYILAQDMFANLCVVKNTNNITLTNRCGNAYLQNKTPFLFHSLRLNHSNHSLAKNVETSGSSNMDQISMASSPSFFESSGSSNADQIPSRCTSVHQTMYPCTLYKHSSNRPTSLTPPANLLRRSGGSDHSLNPTLTELEATSHKNSLESILKSALSAADSVFTNKYVASRTKIGLVLLHLTGLRVSNLLRWSVRNLRELQKCGQTRIEIPIHKGANHERKEVFAKIEEAHSKHFSEKQQVRFQHLLGTPFYVHTVLETIFPNAERRFKQNKQSKRTGTHTLSTTSREIELCDVEKSYSKVDEAQNKFPCSHRLISLSLDEQNILASINTDILAVLSTKQTSTCALFTSKSNPDSSIPISRELFTRQLNKAYRHNQTNITHGGTHNFRVGYILEQLEHKNVEEVKDEICHADIKTTFQYKLKKCL